jgi:hypothetical protein
MNGVSKLYTDGGVLGFEYRFDHVLHVDIEGLTSGDQRGTDPAAMDKVVAERFREFIPLAVHSVGNSLLAIIRPGLILHRRICD